MPSVASTRRAGLIGAAACLAATLTRSLASAAPRGDPPPPNCCGNGPPDVAMYGTGIHPILNQTDPNVALDNPLWGGSTPTTPQGQYYYVFIPETRVKVTGYTDPLGGEHKPRQYTVADYSGVIYRIQPGFKLSLQWPDGVMPDFSTRPLGIGEGGVKEH